MNTQQKIQNIISSFLRDCYQIEEDPQLVIANLRNGDLEYGGALKLSQKIGKAPFVIAQEIAESLAGNNEFTAVAVMPGYVNITFSQAYVVHALHTITEDVEDNFSAQDHKNIMVEYTDPNTFKVFHIGHLMTNAIGESLSRLLSFGGNMVIRANYQGDVGRHIAQAIYGILHSDIVQPDDDASLKEKTQYLGQCYVYGAKAFEESDEIKARIREINNCIYNGGNDEIAKWYEKGRSWSLERFEELYKVLGTKFDYYFFESQTAPIGLSKVKENIPKVFTESDGAIIFAGENYGLHTRVFINKEGLPTYEAKDVGLAYLKYKHEPDLDLSITVTGNEQSEYFKVMRKSVEIIDAHIAAPMHHVYHGMMTGPGGKKMSSRKGEVITGESLLEDVTESAHEIIEKHYGNKKTQEDKKTIAEIVAIAAIKFTILKQDSSKNIVFDLEKALSFEGDSGPYLLYTHARLCSIVRKSHKKSFFKMLKSIFFKPSDQQDIVGELERILIQFPIISQKAVSMMEPHRITTYALELSRAINSWYTNHKVIGAPQETYRMMVVISAKETLKTCIEILGMTALEEM